MNRPRHDSGGPATGSDDERASGLPLLLHRGAEWFNDALIEQMSARGWPRFSRSQSLVFVSIDPQGTRPAELARRLGITRQSTSELLAKLVAHGLLTVGPDDHDRRATVVRLGPRAAALGRDAAQIAAKLETELARRIGADDLVALRRALAQDWGPPPSP